MSDVLPSAGIRLFETEDPDIVRPQYGGRVIDSLLDYHYLVGDRRRFDFSLIVFKPNPIVVCSDPQGDDAI